jgi:hypothetical protein
MGRKAKGCIDKKLKRKSGNDKKDRVVDSKHAQ